MISVASLAGLALALRRDARAAAELVRAGVARARRSPPSATATRDPSITLYATDGTADWLLWRIPDLRGRIAYDVRFELYDQQTLDDIVRYGRREGDWQAVLAGYDVVVVEGPSTGRRTVALVAAGGQPITPTASSPSFDSLNRPDDCVNKPRPRMVSSPHFRALAVVVGATSLFVVAFYVNAPEPATTPDTDSYLKVAENIRHTGRSRIRSARPGIRCSSPLSSCCSGTTTSTR